MIYNKLDVTRRFVAGLNLCTNVIFIVYKVKSKCKKILADFDKEIQSPSNTSHKTYKLYIIDAP